jgi:hypothetical protein
VTASPAKPTAGSAYRIWGGGSGAVDVGGDADVVEATPVEVVGAAVEVVGFATDVVWATVDVVGAAFDNLADVVAVAADNEYTDVNGVLVLAVDAMLDTGTVVDAMAGREDVEVGVVDTVVEAGGADVDVLLTSILTVDARVVNIGGVSVEVVGSNVRADDSAIPDE